MDTSLDNIRQTCSEGNLNLVQELVKYDTSLYNVCLKEACRFGQLEIVTWLVNNGASNVNFGLLEACSHEKYNVVEFLVTRCTNLSLCLQVALCGYRKTNIALLLINHGAMLPNYCVYDMHIENLLNNGLTKYDWNSNRHHKNMHRKITNRRQNVINHVKSGVNKALKAYKTAYWEKAIHGIIAEYISY